MSDPINKLTNFGEKNQKKNFLNKKKLQQKANDKENAKLNEIRDAYISKEKSYKPEYSRDPKIRKFLIMQAGKTKKNK